MLRGVEIGPCQQDAEVGAIGPGVPHLLPVDDVDVAILHRRRGERCEIGAGPGLGEQLTPELVAAQQWAEVPLPLGIGARGENRGTSPSDPDRVVTDRIDTGGGEFEVDGESLQTVCRAAPRLRPPGGNQAHGSEIGRIRIRMFLEKRPHFDPNRMVLIRETRVHRSAESLPNGVDDHSAPQGEQRNDGDGELHVDDFQYLSHSATFAIPRRDVNRDSR